MKKLPCFVGALAFVMASTHLVAQKAQEKSINLDEVVISATKFELKKEKITKVIYKITQKEIQRNAGKSVIELLNNVPGIEIKGTNSNANEIKGIYMRGGRGRQVLVLIDGVPVSDPSGVNQEYDLRMLSLNQIESIEVLKGASSTLYGSGAATGVINIILKKANKNQVFGTYEVSLGTNNTAKTTSSQLFDKNQNVSISGTLDKFNYLGTFAITGVDGMSSAKSNTATIFTNDTYNSTNGFFKLGYKATNNLRFETFFTVDDFDYTFDTGAYTDSDKNNGDQKQMRFGLKSSLKYANGEAYVMASMNELKRNFNQFNSFSNTLDAYLYNGKSVNVDAVNKLNLAGDKIQLITGINYQKHSNHTVTPFAVIDDAVANFNTVDPYASFVYISDIGLNANLGGRLSIHSEYGNHFVYNASVSQSILKNDEATIKTLASYSTAFIAPSLYQLYDGFSGNINLKPESNKTLEIGVESTFNSWLELAVYYFNRKEDNAIIYDNTVFKYGNANSKASGIETQAKFKFLENNIHLNVGYTYTDKDKTGDFSDYIPAHKFVASAAIVSLKNTFIDVVYKNVGDRTYFDRYGSFGPAGNYKTLPSYNLLDINANYKLLQETVTFFGTISNVFNEEYEETLGFNTRGRNFKFGIRLQF